LGLEQRTVLYILASIGSLAGGFFNDSLLQQLIESAITVQSRLPAVIQGRVRLF
jgi:hypothetical protein